MDKTIYLVKQVKLEKKSFKSLEVKAFTEEKSIP